MTETASPHRSPGTPAAPVTCRVCGHVNGSPHRHHASEVMFATAGTYPYVMCGSCGCLQIEQIPDDLAAHYPSGYYSLGTQPPTGVKAWLHQRRFRAAALDANLPGRALLAWSRRSPTPPTGMRSLRLLPNLGVDSKILDVGCGQGALLRQLHAAGFRHLQGFEPFIDRPVTEPGLRIDARPLSSHTGAWDVIMFHHSLEHIPDQRAQLGDAADALAPGGRILVRVPIVASTAWDMYGTDWVQLDAPRHLYLHSLDSMTVLAESCGLRVESVTHDSTAFQFWGSELVAAGEQWCAPDAPGRFSAEEMRVFRQRADHLNRTGRGDQAAFILAR